MGGLIWLRHTRARMGHQVVASPMVRYILHGGRNQSVAVNSPSLIEIRETCTLFLKQLLLLLMLLLLLVVVCVCVRVCWMIG